MPEKKTDKRQLYFIGVILPPPYLEEALKLKQYFSEHHKSKAALNSPPHITLHMPFEWDIKKEERLKSRLQKFSEGCSPISIQFNNFGCFAPRVIFIDIVKSEKLEILQRSLHRLCKQELNLHNANYKELPFHPHVTVAFRDLKKATFKIAWEEFADKKFAGAFTATELTLLKHNGKKWDEFQHFRFSS